MTHWVKIVMTVLLAIQGLFGEDDLITCGALILVIWSI